MAKDNVMLKSPLIKIHDFTRPSVCPSICHECCQKGAQVTPIGQTLILSCFKADWAANQTAPPSRRPSSVGARQRLTVVTYCCGDTVSMRPCVFLVFLCVLFYVDVHCADFLCND